MTTHINRLKCAISNAPGVSGALTIAAAASGFRTFGAAHDGMTVDCLLLDGAAWEVRTGCVYTHSGTSLSRGTLEDSSTGSAINLTSATQVLVTASAAWGNSVERVTRGYIVGGVLAYSSTTAITVSPCALDINGTLREKATSTTLTSGSTMKDLANATVTIGASKCYFVYAYNNAGTLEFRIEDRDNTGDGADPTWDAALDYWKAPSTGAEARRIGKFWTNATSQIINFEARAVGRKRTFFSHDREPLTYVNAGAATSFTSFALTPFVTSDDALVFLEVFATRGGTTGPIKAALSFDGTKEVLNFYFGSATASQVYSLGVPFAVPAATTMYYASIAGSTAYVRLLQTECMV